MACRREYKTRGRTARSFVVEADAARGLGPGRRQTCWQVKLLEGADSEDANQRLWAAVMRDAIAALQWKHPDARLQPGPYARAGSPTANGQWCRETAAALWREACAWVMARGGEPLGTFESVCEVLGLDVEATRRDLCAMAMEHAPCVATVEGTAVVAA